MPASVLSALLMAGSLRLAQLLLLIGMMASPLNGMYSAAYGSGKSSIHPAVGHTLTCAFTYPQNFEYIVCCGTALIDVLNPSAVSPDWTTCISCGPGAALEPTIRTLPYCPYCPVYLQFG